MTRRGFLRSFVGAIAVVAIVPTTLLQACGDLVAPTSVNPLFSGELGIWCGVVIHEMKEINCDLHRGWGAS